MVCPNCKYEYVEGVTECPDCKIPLVNESEIKEPEILNEEDWTIVFTSHYEYEARMIKDNLQAAGIDAAILSQTDRNFPAPGDLSIVKLLVKKQDAEEAVKFIEEFSSNNSSDQQEE